MKIIDLMKTNKKYIRPFRKKEVHKLYNEYLNAGYGLMQFGRELTMLLMCASFPLFSFDSHHCRSSMLESTTSSWRLVSCCTDLMQRLDAYTAYEDKSFESGDVAQPFWQF